MMRNIPHEFVHDLEEQPLLDRRRKGVALAGSGLAAAGVYGITCLFPEIQQYFGQATLPLLSTLPAYAAIRRML